MVARGAVLCGGSSVNLMMYTQAMRVIKIGLEIR